MKLSSGLVTLLAGLAAGNPAMLLKRQADQGAKKALETYCGNGGFEAGDVLEADTKLQGTCRKKDGAKKEGPSVAAATIFCDSVRREFNGAGASYMKADYVIFCGSKVENKPDAAKNSGLALFNQIIADGGDDPKLLEKTLGQLVSDAPSKLVDMYNIIRAPPSTAKLGLGGPARFAASAASFLLTAIPENAKQGGLLGPDTALGRWLRINPIYGKAGTQPSPFIDTDPSGVTLLPQTQKCIAFKDESRWYWSKNVKTCETWHDVDPCDTNYAYDVAKNEGKTQETRCKEEANPPKEKTPEELEKEKEDKLREEEKNCFAPRMTCSNANGKFLYCMDERDIEECKRNQWRPGQGHPRKE
ncbi:hypothetical protein H634G_02680 [Metarhizium anisopliae BRIP 53293]|uniref:Uncharacterized protein n=1 Tax=Metarhizium anisopliae BRIP 53293 TaxID=1291518 RepID=A0A0D9P560_METAN|nr:hypothetical protein H634G_02680 [Metarhizium anisopliae BRIP 53293]KJK90872.1 hypothetical protein H633G_05259 [Metarhizium anisopliae BRIP 53284]